MKIKRLLVYNFRSIKELDINTSDLCALIGPNSSGKSNILRAIDLVLGEGWTTKAKIARELFNDPEKPIIIEIEFVNPIVYTNKNGYDESIAKIKLDMKLTPELYAKTTVNEDATFYSQEQFKKLCHFIYIPSERQLSSELRVSQWTMLGKLMKIVYENYINKYGGNEQKLKKDFAGKIKLAKEFLEDDFAKEQITFDKFKASFRKHCVENSSGLASEFEPILDIYNLNWFYKTLQIHVKEDIPEKHFDSEEVGAGMQNLLMISIFQTYAELMGGKVVFGIEEPEMYLYPQAQRALYKNLIKLSKDTQIFYSTHNQNFVDASRPDDIVLLRKNVDKGTYKLERDEYFSEETAEKRWHKIYTHFNTERNELFFAKKVILVEGDSDKILYSTLCEDRWGIDLDAKGVSIISCGGKGGVNYFVGVCKLIGFDDYFAIWDQDNDKYKPNKDHLPDVLTDKKGLEIAGNLETFVSLPEGKDAEKIKNAYEWAIKVKEENIPIEFIKVKDYLSS
jgi:putative ATP-dependent endonuclease of the OLD family